MNITDEHLSRALTDTMVRDYDRKFCTHCQLPQPAATGRMIRGANGRLRWRCGKCCANAKRPTKP